MTPPFQCPCGSGKYFSNCCEPFIKGLAHAPTAELLMRSRYTAYVVKQVPYLIKTWHPLTVPETIHIEKIPDWKQLEIIKTQKGCETDTDGTVEFKATAISGGKPVVLHEISRFIKE